MYQSIDHLISSGVTLLITATTISRAVAVQTQRRYGFIYATSRRIRVLS